MVGGPSRCVADLAIVTRRTKVVAPSPTRQPGVPRRVGVMLDLDAPAGSYEIDALAAAMPVAPGFRERGIGGAWSVQALRAIVSRIGEEAIKFADAAEHDAARRADARLHLAELEAIAKRCRALIRRDTEPFSYAFAQEEEEELDPAHEALDRINAMAGAIADAIDQLAAERPIGTAINVGNSSRLQHEFVRFAAMRWEIITGRRAPIGKTGPFVRFVAAAWHDLALGDLGDTEAVLGRIAAKRVPD